MNLTEESREAREMSRGLAWQCGGELEGCLSVDPLARLCPRFDEKGIALFELASPEVMGFRVVDNCTETHIQ